MRQRYRFWVLLVFMSVVCGEIHAQYTIQVEGYVKDSITDEPLPDVTVAIRGTTIGTATDMDGYYSIRATSDSAFLMVSYVGYETSYVPIRNGVKNQVHIKLKPSSYELNEVVVRRKKEKYSKKENPAVAFVRNVIARRDLHDPKKQDYFSYDSYEQRMFARDEFDVEKARQRKVYKRMDFIYDYVDSTSVKGRTMLPLYNEEVIEHFFFRKSPRTERRVVKGHKRAGLIEMVSEDGIQQFVEEAFREVNPFQDNIALLLNRFVSPLSSIGPNYYKYYLLDTLMLDGEPYMDLGFAPFNSESFGFVGHLYVTLDSTFFVKKIDMNVPRDIHLNFVDEMSINQEYTRTDDGTRLLTKNEVSLVFKLYEKMKGMYARRIVLYRNHSFDKPEEVAVFDEKSPVVESGEARNQSEMFWNEAREGADEIQKTSVDDMMDNLRQVPLYYWTEKTIDLLVNGYVQTSPTNSKFEFGPVNTFISGNALEGLRLRTGGATTVNLSRRLFLDGYMAYGFKDNKVKGNAILEYSFNKKQKFRKEYPFHYLRAEYRYDINQIGQHYLYNNADNMFMMLKRRENNLITYMQRAELSYYQENYKGVGYGVKLRHLKEWATPDVPFSLINADGTDVPADHYTSAQLEFSFRWAPNEKFYQTRNYRYAITIDAPIITLTHAMARKGIFGTDHHYNRTEIGVRKRFWMSPFGYINIYGQAGMVWNRVPYPLLLIPNANLSYSVEVESYQLMDPMEFINDRFLSWEASYNLNGWLFNRLPLIKKLQLREIVSFRGWYGDLSDKNNPAVNGDGLYRFPENTHLMGKKPYMEMSVGFENLFKIFRVDYVWRLSYRNHPDVPNRGVRFKMTFSF